MSIMAQLFLLWFGIEALRTGRAAKRYFETKADFELARMLQMLNAMEQRERERLQRTVDAKEP